MKPDSTPTQKKGAATALRFACIVASVFLVGCYSRVSYRLRLIDNDSGKPLEGVTVDIETDGYYLGLRPFHKWDDRTFSPTGPDGVVEILNVLPQPDFYTDFQFHKQGYQRQSLNNGESEWNLYTYPGQFNEDPSHEARIDLSRQGQTVDVRLYQTK